MGERITVEIDGGPAGAAALAWAIDRARQLQASLKITAVDGRDAVSLAESSIESGMSYSALLERAAERARESLPTAELTTELLIGSAEKRMLEQSRAADLLVIGTARAHPIAGVLRAPLPLKVAGRADCATVFVPTGWTPTDGRVVVGWNDDPNADAALDFAAKEAATLGVGLTIVHTWTPLRSAPMSSAPVPHAAEQNVAAQRALVVDAARRIQLVYPELSIVEHVHAGSTAAAIVKAAADASLVVVGSRGRGAIASFFLGSVSQDVLLTIPVPVAVIPATHSVSRREVPLPVDVAHENR